MTLLPPGHQRPRQKTLLRLPKLRKFWKKSVEPELLAANTLPTSTLAEELAQLGYVRADSPRNNAHIIIRASSEMVRRVLRDEGVMHLVTGDRSETYLRLAQSLRDFHWDTLGLDPEVMRKVLDEDASILLVQRIALGESLHFLEDLFYERFLAIDRFGIEQGASLSILQLTNYRRGRLSHALQPSRRLPRVPTGVGGEQ